MAYLLYEQVMSGRLYVRNLTVLSSTLKINHIRNHFWYKLRHEYEVNLRETQLNTNSPKIDVNDIALVYDKRCPDTFGELP